MIRAILLAFTIATLISLYLDRPKSVQAVQVDYCLNDIRVAGKHPLTGEWQYGWAKGYGPCSEQDIFRDI